MLLKWRCSSVAKHTVEGKGSASRNFSIKGSRSLFKIVDVEQYQIEQYLIKMLNNKFSSDGDSWIHQLINLSIIPEIRFWKTEQ